MGVGVATPIVDFGCGVGCARELIVRKMDRDYEQDEGVAAFGSARGVKDI